MPTEKRERQRAGREARRAQLEEMQRRSKVRVRGVTIGVIAVIVVVVLVLVNRGGPKTTPAASSTHPATKASGAAGCPAANGSSPRTTSFSHSPPMCINTALTYTANFTTDVGSFTVMLDAKRAPVTTNNFVYLADYHFYDGLTFHRVIPGFVVQGGDPEGTGHGGPGYSFRDELPATGAYKVGSVAMANSGPNTNGSQFFIITGQQGVQLPPRYSLFGQVTSGMNVVQRIEADGSTSPSGTPKLVHRMLKVTITQS